MTVNIAKQLEIYHGGALLLDANQGGDHYYRGQCAQLHQQQTLNPGNTTCRHKRTKSQSRIHTVTNKTLQVENKELKLTVNTLTTQVETISNENNTMNETILDLQSRSMRDNLIFTGIKEQPKDNPEQAIKEFMQSSLKLPHDTVHNKTFHRVHRVHRIGAKNNSRQMQMQVDRLYIDGQLYRDRNVTTWL